MLKKYILFSFILAVSAFFVCLGAEAIIAPQVYFTDINIDKENFNAGDTISGSVALWNYENYVMSDLVLHVQLFSNDKDGLADQLIDSKQSGDAFTLNGGEKSSKSFSYAMPSNLPEGGVTLRVQLVSNRSEQLSWIDKAITVENGGTFLTLGNYWILHEGPLLEQECLPAAAEEGAGQELVGKEGQFGPGLGINFRPNELPKAKFDISNPSSSDISAYYKIVVYERNYGSKIASEKKSGLMEVKAGSEETIRIELEKIEIPGSYLAEVKYYDEKDNPISNSVFFRWVIAGEGAKIMHVKLDKAAYDRGERAKVEAEVVGPAGFCSKLTGEEVFEVKLFDEDGRVVGQANTKLVEGVIALSLEIPISRSVSNPRVEATVKRGGDILDSYNSQLNAQIEQKSMGGFSSLYTWALIIIIIISIAVIIVASYFIFKSKRR